MKGSRAKRGLAMLALVVSMVSLGAVADARAQRPYRVNDRQVERLLKSIERRADRVEKSVKDAYPDTERRGEVKRLLSDLESATDQLLDRFKKRRSGPYDVEVVLQRAALLDRYLDRHPLNPTASRDWMLMRGDLDRLARTYQVARDWNTRPANPYGVPVAYRLNDRQMMELLRRIETRSDALRKSLSDAVNRARLDRQRKDEVKLIVSNYEDATDRLLKRYRDRESDAIDAEAVLQRAALIDSFVMRHRLDAAAQRDWSLLRGDLDQLAIAYNVA